MHRHPAEIGAKAARQHPAVGVAPVGVDAPSRRRCPLPNPRCHFQGYWALFLIAGWHIWAEAGGASRAALRMRSSVAREMASVQPVMAMQNLMRRARSETMILRRILQHPTLRKSRQNLARLSLCQKLWAGADVRALGRVQDPVTAPPPPRSAWLDRRPRSRRPRPETAGARPCCKTLRTRIERHRPSDTMPSALSLL